LKQKGETRMEDKIGINAKLRTMQEQLDRLFELHNMKLDHPANVKDIRDHFQLTDTFHTIPKTFQEVYNGLPMYSFMDIAGNLKPIPVIPKYKVGSKVLIMGHRDVGDRIYKILEIGEGRSSFNGIGAIRINAIEAFENGWWLNTCDCEVFQPIIEGPFDANLIPKDKIKGYKVWVRGDNSESMGWQSIESIDFNLVHDRIGIHLLNGYSYRVKDSNYLCFQPSEVVKSKPVHIYGINDCFIDSDKDILRLSKAENESIGILVYLTSKIYYSSMQFTLKEWGSAVMYQSDFKIYLESNDMTYIGTFDEVFKPII